MGDHVTSSPRGDPRDRREYRRLGVPKLEELIRPGVFYGGMRDRGRDDHGEHVVVAGGNSAGQAALHVAQYARHVTLVGARPGRWPPACRTTSCASSRSPPTSTSAWRPRSWTAARTATGWLDYVVLRSRAPATEEQLPADELFVMIGADPRTELAAARDQPRRAPASSSPAPTSPRRRVAAGARADRASRRACRASWPRATRGYGSVKRVASAAGEGSVAIQSLHRILASAPQRVS